MNSLATKTVRDLAVEIPGATRVFENLGIDYCCGGKRSLADACAAVGVPLEDVENSLEVVNVPHAQFEEPNFLTATLAELIDHIVEKHHVFTKTEMARLGALMDKVHSVHGQNHPELATIRSMFQSLSSELEPHMMKEERVLFPFIMGMEDAVHTSAVSVLIENSRRINVMKQLGPDGRRFGGAHHAQPAAVGKRDGHRRPATPQQHGAAIRFAGIDS